MSVFRDLYRGETHYDVVGNRRRWFIVSAVLVGISLLSLLTLELDLGVDFEGGTVVEAENPGNADIEDVRAALAAIGQEDARVQMIGGGAGIRLQTVELDAEATNDLIDAVAGVAGVTAADVSVQAVGPTFGEQVAQSALRALIIFLIIIAGFIAIRFEWKMALVAIATLFHDLILTAGVYSLVGFEVTPATVIAILTILGYSLYDTVVVFDKILENVEASTGKTTITEIVNGSLNQVLMRSLNTSLTSLLPVGSLLFVGSFLLGAATLREFALALFVGIAVGTYSSIFFAGPLLAAWKESEGEWQRARRRAARRSTSSRTDDRARRRSRDPEEEPEPAAAPSISPPAVGATPRPPKRRRRKR